MTTEKALRILQNHRALRDDARAKEAVKMMENLYWSNNSHIFSLHFIQHYLCGMESLIKSDIDVIRDGIRCTASCNGMDCGLSTLRLAGVR